MLNTLGLLQRASSTWARVITLVGLAVERKVANAANNLGYCSSLTLSIRLNPSGTRRSENSELTNSRSEMLMSCEIESDAWQTQSEHTRLQLGNHRS